MSYSNHPPEIGPKPSPKSEIDEPTPERGVTRRPWRGLLSLQSRDSSRLFARHNKHLKRKTPASIVKTP